MNIISATISVDTKENPYGFCGGMHGCAGRAYDLSKADCSECLVDATSSEEAVDETR
jgi:hypothetical protein